MAEFDLIAAIKRAAMLAVTRETAEFNLRQLQRWYSEKFNTSLEDVEDLPVETLGLHYFEVRYYGMSPEEREVEMRLLSETEDQRLDRLRKDELAEGDDDSFLRHVEEEAKRATASAKALTKQLEAGIPGTTSEASKAIPTQVQNSPALTSIPEGIDMEFISDDEMEDMNEWDILGPPKKQ